MDFKIALVGCSQLSFFGDKETRFSKTAEDLHAFLKPLKADLFVYPEQIIVADDAKKALKVIDAEKPDFLLVQCTSFSAGYLAQIFVNSGYPLGWWAIPENAEGDYCLYNSLCSINMYQAINRCYYNEEQHPAKWFYGEVDDPLFADRMKITVRALRAIKRVKTSRVALIGGIAPGFVDLYFDERKLLRLFPGLEYDRLPEFDDIAALAESYPEAEIIREAEAYEKAAALGVHPVSAKHKLLNVRLLHAYREFAKKNQYDALAISCWPKFQSRYDYSVCSVVGQLNDEGIPTSCEGDPLSAVSMLMLEEMTGEPTMLMDLSAFDCESDTILLWHCGPAASNFCCEKGYALGLNYSGKAHHGVLTGTGCVRDLVFAPNRLTIGRLSAELDSLFIGGGDVLDPSQKTSIAGSRGWMGNLQIANEDISALDFVNTILSQGISHHYPLCKGDLQAELMEIAAWLKLSVTPKTPYKPWLQM
jgi:L-fucose isomerase-like protein